MVEGFTEKAVELGQSHCGSIDLGFLTFKAGKPILVAEVLMNNLPAELTYEDLRFDFSSPDDDTPLF